MVSPIDRTELRRVLRLVRHWAIDLDDAADRILELLRGEVKPPPPDQTGTPLAGAPVEP